MTTKPPVREYFEHDICQDCGMKSVPAEGVPDQSLRGCEQCGHVWFEDLDEPPTKCARMNRVVPVLGSTTCDCPRCDPPDKDPS